MNITRSVQKWGNGTGLRLPKQVLEAAHIEPGQPLRVTLEGKSIVLTPVDEPERVTLDELLEGVTPENVHGEFDWGPDVGAERWYE
jgi:antitoxin MazE